jgi:hypothetical protein
MPEQPERPVGYRQAEEEPEDVIAGHGAERGLLTRIMNARRQPMAKTARNAVTQSL